MNAIIYDIEIAKCIPAKGGLVEPGFDYCEGWTDYKGMGIACIGVYDYVDERYKVFLEDNLDVFAALVKTREVIAGFNNLSFDDKLCHANGIDVRSNYDLLVEVRVASNQPAMFVKGLTRAGYNLDALAEANLPIKKSGRGDLAPMMWQSGERGAVIDYCLQDVAITKRLIELGKLTDPTNGKSLLIRTLRA